MTPSAIDYYIKVSAEVFNSFLDFDFIVEMSNSEDKQCDLGPCNKLCSCSAHAHDVQTGSGDEVVILRTITVTQYNAYVRTSPAYQKICQHISYLRIVEDTSGLPVNEIEEIKQPSSYEQSALHLQDSSPIDWRHIGNS